MNFTSHQDKAKTRTVLLLLFYLACVAALAFIVTALAVLVFGGDYDPGVSSLQMLKKIIVSPKFALALLGFFAFLGLAGGFKYLSLRSGGKTVAESMAARLLAPQATDFHERRLLNIVEEMALASGVPVPPVYVLDQEQGINAFAAGFSINDAVIGVTRGAMEILNRDELQAVIAHEFSHILNGDMRLNMRFAGLLFGIFCFIQAAKMFLPSFRSSGSGVGSVLASTLTPRRKANPAGTLFWFLVGLVLLIMGALVSALGKIIQAAINRQREYLADASAVQFTRSTALASALKKIGGLQYGSKLAATEAGNYSHFFLCRIDGGLLSTHPPLHKRILRIEPAWDGIFPEVLIPAARSSGGAGMEGGQTAASLHGGAEASSPTAVAARPEETTAKLHTACREPLDACCLMLALLLDDRPDIRNKQLRLTGYARQIEEYNEAWRAEPVDRYVPLIEMAVPALKTLSARQYQDFKSLMLQFIHADDAFVFREWILYQLISRQVGAGYAQNTDPGSRYADIAQVDGEAVALLATVARLAEDAHEAQSAFSAGLAKMGLPERPIPPPAMDTLESCLEKLQQGSESLRKRFLAGVQGAVDHDLKVTAEEAMFLRVISLCLDCPVAPPA